MVKISKRMEEIVTALPLKEGVRILEIGCGTGVVAREIAKRFNDVYLLGIDRSAKAIKQCVYSSPGEISSGKLQFQKVAVEDFQTVATSCLISHLQFELEHSTDVTRKLKKKHSQILPKHWRKRESFSLMEAVRYRKSIQ
jgi:trans-aconitate methyltransferase